MEQKGFGVNKLTFWVTNDCNLLNCIKNDNKVLEEWIELPLITPL